MRQCILNLVFNIHDDPTVKNLSRSFTGMGFSLCGKNKELCAMDIPLTKDIILKIPMVSIFKNKF